ncbi:MAG: biopolymer transporter ExbD [Methylobacteriaceae bacterium]|nr:biopolymer transporter ExbD [Methylobacteriaceae bacterium]
MGMSASAGRKGGRRRRGTPRYGAMAEINMTPFIDVMLVLLIIFMVAAPLLATGVPIDLPQTKAAPLNIEQKPIAIAIDERGQIFLMDQPVRAEEIVGRLQSLARNGYEERIYIRGARAVNYGRVAEIMSLVTGAGYKKVALVTEPEGK